MVLPYYKVVKLRVALYKSVAGLLTVGLLNVPSFSEGFAAATKSPLGDPSIFQALSEPTLDMLSPLNNHHVTIGGLSEPSRVADGVARSQVVPQSLLDVTLFAELLAVVAASLTADVMGQTNATFTNAIDNDRRNAKNRFLKEHRGLKIQNRPSSTRDLENLFSAVVNEMLLCFRNTFLSAPNLRGAIMEAQPAIRHHKNAALPLPLALNRVMHDASSAAYAAGIQTFNDIVFDPKTAAELAATLEVAGQASRKMPELDTVIQQAVDRLKTSSPENQKMGEDLLLQLLNGRDPLTWWQIERVSQELNSYYRRLKKNRERLNLVEKLNDLAEILFPDSDTKVYRALVAVNALRIEAQMYLDVNDPALTIRDADRGINFLNQITVSIKNDPNYYSKVCDLKAVLNSYAGDAYQVLKKTDPSRTDDDKRTIERYKAALENQKKLSPAVAAEIESRAALTFLELGRHDRVLMDRARALSVEALENQHTFYPFYVASRVALHDKQWGKAIGYLQNAKRLNPDSTAISAYLIRAYVQAGYFKEADAELETHYQTLMSKKEAISIGAYYNEGLLAFKKAENYHSQGQEKEARLFYEESQRIWQEIILSGLVDTLDSDEWMAFYTDLLRGEYMLQADKDVLSVQTKVALSHPDAVAALAPMLARSLRHSQDGENLVDVLASDDVSLSKGAELVQALQNSNGLNPGVSEALGTYKQVIVKRRAKEVNDLWRKLTLKDGQPMTAKKADAETIKGFFRKQAWKELPADAKAALLSGWSKPGVADVISVLEHPHLNKDQAAVKVVLEEIDTVSKNPACGVKGLELLLSALNYWRGDAQPVLATLNERSPKLIQHVDTLRGYLRDRMTQESEQTFNTTETRVRDWLSREPQDPVRQPDALLAYLDEGRRLSEALTNAHSSAPPAFVDRYDELKSAVRSMYALSRKSIESSRDILFDLEQKPVTSFYRPDSETLDSFRTVIHFLERFGTIFRPGKDVWQEIVDLVESIDYKIHKEGRRQLRHAKAYSA